MVNFNMSIEELKEKYRKEFRDNNKLELINSFKKGGFIYEFLNDEDYYINEKIQELRKKKLERICQ